MSDCNYFYALAQYNLGLVMQEAFELKNAEARYKIVTKVYPEVFRASNNLGVLFQGDGELAGAKINFNRSILVCP